MIGDAVTFFGGSAANTGLAQHAQPPTVGWGVERDVMVYENKLAEGGFTVTVGGAGIRCDRINQLIHDKKIVPPTENIFHSRNLSHYFKNSDAKAHRQFTRYFKTHPLDLRMRRRVQLVWVENANTTHAFKHEVHEAFKETFDEADYVNWLDSFLEDAVPAVMGPNVYQKLLEIQSHNANYPKFEVGEPLEDGLNPVDRPNGHVSAFMEKDAINTAWGKLKRNIEQYLQHEEMKSVLQHEGYGLNIELVNKLRDKIIEWGQNRMERRYRHPTYKFLRRVAGVIGERVERYYDHPYLEKNDNDDLNRLVQAHLDQRGTMSQRMDPELIDMLVSDPEVSGNYQMTCEVQAALEEVYAEFILCFGVDSNTFTIKMLLEDEALSMQFAALTANTIKKNRHTEPKKFYKDQELRYIDAQINKAWKFVYLLMKRQDGIQNPHDTFALEM